MGTGGHQGPCETLGAQVLATLTEGLLKRDVGPSSGLVPISWTVCGGAHPWGHSA